MVTILETTKLKELDFTIFSWYNIGMVTRSFEETYDYGFQFAKKLHGGEVIGLIGDLGSGKTSFVKGLAEGLGVNESVTSPTFVILKEYNILRPNPHLRGVGKKVRSFIHVDAYRVEDIEDIKSVGIEDYLGRDDVIVAIEWAEKVMEILPKDTISINFRYLSEKERRISIKFARA